MLTKNISSARRIRTITANIYSITSFPTKFWAGSPIPIDINFVVIIIITIHLTINVIYCIFVI